MALEPEPELFSSRNRNRNHNFFKSRNRNRNHNFSKVGTGTGTVKNSYGCRVDVSPNDVSPTENSWMLRPLNKASLGNCVPDRCVPTLDRVTHGTSSVAHYRGLRRMHARPTHRTPLLRSGKARGSWKSGVTSLNQIKGMGWFGQGQITKGHFVQGKQHPRILGRGHIRQGWTNIAPTTLPGVPVCQNIFLFYQWQ
jgi:hypothetical protein